MNRLYQGFAWISQNAIGVLTVVIALVLMSISAAYTIALLKVTGDPSMLEGYFWALALAVGLEGIGTWLWRGWKSYWPPEWLVGQDVADEYGETEQTGDSPYYLMDGRALFDTDRAMVLECCSSLEEAQENIEDYGADTCIVEVSTMTVIDSLLWREKPYTK